MSAAITIEIQPRNETGSAHARRLRQEGQVPAVLYKHGEPAEGVQLNRHRFEQMLRQHSSESLLVDLVSGKGDTRKALVKEVQRHPLGKQVVHVDFLEVSMTEKIRVEIPVELTGVPAGVSQGGGILESLIHSIQVECLPGDLVEKFSVDVSAMEVGHRLKVADLKLDTSLFTVLTPGHIAIATVDVPKMEEEPAPVEAAAATAEGAAPAEPELVKPKRAEEEKE